MFSLLLSVVSVKYYANEKRQLFRVFLTDIFGKVTLFCLLKFLMEDKTADF